MHNKDGRMGALHKDCRSCSVRAFANLNRLVLVRTIDPIYEGGAKRLCRNDGRTPGRVHRATFKPLTKG